jgi:uncharacterized membrane protein
MKRTLMAVVVAANMSGAPLVAQIQASDHRGCAKTVTIDVPGANATEGRDISPAADSYVGEYVDGAGKHGFLLQDETFTTIDWPDAISTDAHAINSLGAIVGVYRIPEEHGYLLTSEGSLPIDVPNALATSVQGINDRGDMVGGYCDVAPCFPEGNRGYLLSEGQFTTIDVPGATVTQAWKINAKRDVVGVYTDTAGVFHGFLWHAGTFESIDVPGAAGTIAFGINNRGDIVGSYCLLMPCGVPIVNNHGFLLRRGEFTLFDFPDAEATRPFSINARGEIAGTYRDRDGQRHAFLATSR